MTSCSAEQATIGSRAASAKDTQTGGARQRHLPLRRGHPAPTVGANADVLIDFDDAGNDTINLSALARDFDLPRRPCLQRCQPGPHQRHRGPRSHRAGQHRRRRGARDGNQAQKHPALKHDGDRLCAGMTSTPAGDCIADMAMQPLSAAWLRSAKLLSKSNPPAYWLGGLFFDSRATAATLDLHSCTGAVDEADASEFRKTETFEFSAIRTNTEISVAPRTNRGVAT